MLRWIVPEDDESFSDLAWLQNHPRWSQAGGELSTSFEPPGQRPEPQAAEPEVSLEG